MMRSIVWRVPEFFNSQPFKVGQISWAYLQNSDESQIQALEWRECWNPHLLHKQRENVEGGISCWSKLGSDDKHKCQSWWGLTSAGTMALCFCVIPITQALLKSKVCSCTLACLEGTLRELNPHILVCVRELNPHILVWDLFSHIKYWGIPCGKGCFDVGRTSSTRLGPFSGRYEFNSAG